MKSYFTEIFLFSSSLTAAYLLGWNNTDLIWSFWITSLVVGYVSIFRISAAPLGFLCKSILSPEDIKKFRELPTNEKLKIALFALFFIPMSLFFVVFLSFHFLMFHLLLAYWLQMIMPHSSITDILADANGGGFYISIRVIIALLMSYWIIVINKLIYDYKTNWKSSSNMKNSFQQSFFSFEYLKRPYVVVVRIIALVVLLFWLNSIEANQYIVYIVIYSLFYFPVPNFRKAKS